MVRAEIIFFNYTPSAPVGGTLTFNFGLRNTGDQAGNLIGAVSWIAGGLDGVVWGTWGWILAGSQVSYLLELTMPDQDLTISFLGFSWDEARQVSVLNHFRGPFTVELEVPPTPGLPHPRVFEPSPITKAAAGSAVPYGAYVLNDGGTGADFRLRATIAGVNYSDVLYTPYRWLEPGAATTLSSTFLMPDLDIEVRLQAEWYDVQSLAWILDGNVILHTIAVIREEIPYLALPSWLLAALQSPYINFPRGAWINVSILGVGIILPPFSFTPGWWVRDALNWTLGGINWLIDWVRSTLQTAIDAWDMAWAVARDTEGWFDRVTSFVGTFLGAWWTETLQDVINRIGEAVDAVQAALGFRIGFLEDWAESMQALDLSWENIYRNVSDFIVTSEPFATMIGGFNRLTDIVDALPGELWDFFSNPAGWIFDKIDDWLNESVE